MGKIVQEEWGERLNIYVAAYPKSGSTWLTNLLGDALNSPTGGNRPSQDSTEIATNLTRTGKHFIRKGHYKLVSSKSNQVVPAAHELNWQFLDNSSRVIFLIRDPRDICISGAYHWHCGHKDFLRRMIAGSVAGLPRWDDYILDWLKVMNMSICDGIFKVVKYEALHKDTDGVLRDILKFCDIKNTSKINEAIVNQSFNVKRAELLSQNQDLKKHNMRKGIVGDWRNHFTFEMQDKIDMEFGKVMRSLGYE